MPRIDKLVSMFAVIVAVLSVWWADNVQAQSAPTPVCPSQGIQPRPANFQPGGIVLTTFDRDSIWVYEIEQDTRYPLPETVPCTRNCRPSPNGLWLTRMDSENGFTFTKMRFDGTQRTPLVDGATDVRWWDENTLLVWTPDHRAYLVPEVDANTAPRDYLDVSNVVAVQPGGRHALTVRQDETGVFVRILENLELRGLNGVAGVRSVLLGEDISYYNGAAWSPSGTWLAYVATGTFDDSIGTYGSELFGIRPGDAAPTQWTDLHSAYGATRINGHTLGDLSWSPDGTTVAFWVTELIGSNPLADTGNATIHTYNIQSGELRAYCAYSTIEHTPNPPRLAWSPDSTHIAFGGNIPGDDQGYLLLALNTAEGTYTQLSAGIYPALGMPDVIGWGQRP